MDLVQRSDAGLHCPAGGFWIDPWRPVPLAVVTHAHADHARPGHARVICAGPSAGLLRQRLGEDAPLDPVAYGERLTLGGVTLSLHPAGHVLGSAQVRLEGPEATWVVTGDFKRAPDPTCAPFEVVPCDVLVTEATFALPIYRWPEPARAIDDLLAWWSEARAAGRTCLLFCYALGKAQRVLAELAARGVEGPVYLHGAVDSLAARYREAGVVLPETRLVRDTGQGAKLEGELVLAPVSAQGTPWMKRFPRAEKALASGWMRLRGTRRRKAVQRGFVLSDHADWPALLRTVEETGARRVLATHGASDVLARFLREERGLEAEVLATDYGLEDDEA